MAEYRDVRPTRVLMGKLDHEADLLDQLTSICRQNNIRLGRIEAIGTVRKARIGFYDQQDHRYLFTEVDKPLEISSLAGNVSMRDGEVAIHAHITLCDRDGRAYGGHLASGTIVFACEFVIEAYDGAAFERRPDAQTGLPLWQF